MPQAVKTSKFQVTVAVSGSVSGPRASPGGSLSHWQAGPAVRFRPAVLLSDLSSSATSGPDLKPRRAVFSHAESPYTVTVSDSECSTDAAATAEAAVTEATPAASAGVAAAAAGETTETEARAAGRALEAPTVTGKFGPGGSLSSESLSLKLEALAAITNPGTVT